MSEKTILPVTNLIYITSLGTREERDFARMILNAKKSDGVNVFQLIAMILPTTTTSSAVKLNE